MGTCKSCGREADLRESHIIPEWAFKGVYTKKHKFAAISTTRATVFPQQKGWREPLLCGDCEVYLSRLENALFRDSKYLRSGIREVAFREGFLVSYCRKALPSYEDFKRGLLSILWRMSVSARPEFSHYSLGEHEDPIRRYIFDPAITLNWAEYPITVFRLTIGEKTDTGILMTYPQTGYAGTILTHSYAIYGLQFNTYIYRPRGDGAIKRQIMEMESVALADSGKLTVADLDVVRMLQGSSLYDKLMSPEVKEFYRRYS